MRTRKSRAKSSQKCEPPSESADDKSVMIVEETIAPGKASNTTKSETTDVGFDKNSTMVKIPYKPGKWRKSMSLRRASMTRGQRSYSIAGSRRITMHTVQQPDDLLHQSSTDNTSLTFSHRQSATNDVSIQQFIAPLSWKTVADQRYLCPNRAKEEILTRCGQTEPIVFDSALENLHITVERKIGEGVYGEVFLCKKANDERSVLKLIPIEGNCLINGEKQKSFEEIISEVVISSQLSDLRKRDAQFCTDAFVELRSISCIVGQYPPRLVELWDEYNSKHGSENDSPIVYSNDQLFIAFETAFGGSDLDGFRFKNALQAFSVFSQILLALAVAEKRYDFEHRDLHTGNILIESTSETERTYYLLGEEIVIQTHGVKATIIDYTLSRIVYNGLCLFNDLSTDEELFTAEGDYQFEIYRNMKAILRNQWDLFAPKTNVYWLHYLLNKLTSARNYRDKSSKAHRATMKTMQELSDVLMQFKSVHDIVRHYFASEQNEDDKEN
uniref:non-specific serine/threonine protein kinase n=1 Tax=Anopheles farauti TaxID=69004 RepID=A0A9I3GIS4_9DIPT